MPFANENCFVRCLTGRNSFVERMNNLGTRGWTIIWQTYKEDEALGHFEAYFYRKYHVKKFEEDED